MRMISLFATGLACVVALGCTKKVNYTDEQIPQIKKLDDLMDAQAAAADPQFKKAGNSTFSDTDYAGIADSAHRIELTSAHIKDFSKGPEFDGLAMKLHDAATALAAAGQAKDAAATKTALTGMKSVCKECHSKFK